MTETKPTNEYPIVERLGKRSYMSRVEPSQLMLAPLSIQLYDVICNRIISGELQQGQRIDMKQLAAEFQVSTTPVRDAIQQLEQDSLVESRPRAGTFVAKVSLEDVRDICEVRKGIEWLAAQLAAENLPQELLLDMRSEAEEALRQAEAGSYELFFQSDNRIHGVIVNHTHNKRLIQIRNSIEPFVDWIRVLGATGTNRIAGSTKRHYKIIDALLDGDAEEAARHSAIHLEEIEEWTVEDMASLGFE